MIQSRRGLGCQASGRAIAAAALVALAIAQGARAEAAPPDDARRYAPVLWPAPGEPYVPTHPPGLAPRDSVASDAVSGARVLYRRAHAAGGITIHQYWMYYRWDVGHRGHEHDAETFSVFVDSTGAVVGAAGSAHGPATLNNIVRARSRSAAPLPEHLHVLVEYGKHACAPDVDGDGRFEPGVDANLLGGEAWGVQDARLHVPEDRIFEATVAPQGSPRTYTLEWLDELRDAAASTSAQAPQAPPDPRRDLWLHRSYEAPQDVLEPWLTDFVAVTTGAWYDVGGVVSGRLGFLWAKEGGPLGERAIEPFASYDFARERVGDFGMIVHENRSGGLGLHFGAWGNDEPYQFNWGPAVGATLLRWDRGGISGLGHGDVTIGVDIHADVTQIGDTKFIVAAGFGFPFVSREPARRLFAR